MPFLPGLAVVFVGIVGGGHGKVDQQVKSIVKDLHVTSKALPTASVTALTRHKGATKAIVQKLHAEGVVSFEVIGGKELRLVTYGADGVLKTYLELSLEGGALAGDDVQTLKESIADDFAIKAPSKAPETQDEFEMDPVSAPAPAPQPLVVKAVAVVPKPAPAKSAASLPVGDDDEMPANLGKNAPRAAAKAAPKAEIKREATHEETAAPAETADASSDSVSLADIEAATGAEPSADGSSGGGGGSDTDLHTSLAAGEAPLHLGASLGFGVTGRLFSPGPSTIVGYSSTPVGMISAQGHISPTANTRLHVLGESTVAMSSPMSTGNNAPTSIMRWEATGGYAVTHGAVELTPVVGFGRRTFAIDSTDPSRTPDSEYDYLIAGVNAAMPLGGRITVRGNMLFEPVVAGAEPTEMALGDATRWALDVGGSVEMRFTHLFARAGVDWQRFSWSWDMAGNRGAGGAVDNYASGTLSLGADY